MQLPTQAVTPANFDQLMNAGYRRSGAFYYNTQCPRCTACEPLRIDVNRIQFTRSQRRVLQRADELRLELSEPLVEKRRVELFNLHRHGRNLAQDNFDIGVEDYRSFLLNARNQSLELSLWKEELLLSVAITDIGANCLSAVYCCFDPKYSQFSLGTLSILYQIEMARTANLQWLYLGFHVAANKHLAYKARFKPHQRRINGQWHDFP